MVEDSLDTVRKRLLYRSQHRGTKEVDLLLGQFAERHLPGFDAAALADFERLLDAADDDLYCWMTGRETATPPPDSPVGRMLQTFRYEPRQR